MYKLTFIWTAFFGFGQLHAQEYFSKVFKVNKDSAQYFSTSYVQEDILYTYIALQKLGKQSAMFAKFDTSLNLLHKRDYTDCSINTSNSSSVNDGSYYKTAKEVKPDGTFSDSIFILKNSLLNEDSQRIKIKSTGNLSLGVCDYLDNYKGINYVYSADGYEESGDPYRLIIDLYNSDLGFLERKHVNLGKKHWIQDLIVNDDAIYILTSKYMDIGRVNTLIKINKEYEIAWEKIVEINSSINPNGSLYFVGNDVLVATYAQNLHDPFVCSFYPTVTRVDPDSNTIWRTEFKHKFESGFHKMVVLNNDDILITGQKASEPLNGQAAWLVRMDRNGIVLWNKQYTDIRAGEAPFCDFFNAHELAGGNLICTGMLVHEEVDSLSGTKKILTSCWAVKIGPNGCPGAECPNDVKEYTLGRYIYSYCEEPTFKIYPNPGENNCTIVSENEQINFDKIIIHNVLGYVVFDSGNISGQKVSLITDEWTKGIYFISIIHENKVLSLKKWIKN